MRAVCIAKWTLDSVALRDAFTDFILSRQAKQCSPSTVTFYQYTCGKFLTWLEGQGVTQPPEVTARHVRQYLASLTGRQDTTIRDTACGVRVLLRFWHAEKYTPDLIKFDMPRVAKKRLPVLTVDELRTVLVACNVRDKAIVMLMVDSGLRRSEVIALNWDDLDFSNGLLRVKRGKGGKARSAVVGVTSRRALLAYRRTIDASGAMFLSQKGGRLTKWGLGLMFTRLSKATGIHVTPHALRRTFTILSLRSGMDVLHLQALGGWSGLEMVSHYAQMVDDDLLQAHREHSPVDSL